jgi:hypothetical protein
VVAVVYADVDRALWWAAEWSVRAQLDYLAREDAPTPVRENGSGPGIRESGPGAGGLDLP